MSFRIAIGRCDCEGPYRDRIEELACGIIDSTVELWRDRLPADLPALPSEGYEEHLVEGHAITLGTHRHDLDNGGSLVAFQALVHTWSKPTFLSLGAVGRMYAEGLVVSSEGEIEAAPDELMWRFR